MDLECSHIDCPTVFCGLLSPSRTELVHSLKLGLERFLRHPYHITQHQLYTSLNSINLLVFFMVTQCVLCTAGTNSLGIFSIHFELQRVTVANKPKWNIVMSITICLSLFLFGGSVPGIEDRPDVSPSSGTSPDSELLPFSLTPSSSCLKCIAMSSPSKILSLRTGPQQFAYVHAC